MRWKNSWHGDAGLRDIADLLRPESPAARPRGGRRSNAAGTGPQRGPERGPDVDPSPSSCGGTVPDRRQSPRFSVGATSCSPPSWAVRCCTRYRAKLYLEVQDPSTVGSAGTGSGAGAQTPGISAASPMDLLPFACFLGSFSRAPDIPWYEVLRPYWAGHPFPISSRPSPDDHICFLRAALNLYPPAETTGARHASDGARKVHIPVP